MSQLIVLALMGFVSGVAMNQSLRRVGMLGSIPVIWFTSTACAVASSQVQFDRSTKHSVVIGCFVLGALLSHWFGGGGRWKRLKKKTSEALRNLIEKVKVLAPTPNPVPIRA